MSLARSLDRAFSSPAAATPPLAANAARGALGSHAGAGSPVLEPGVLAQIDGLAAAARSTRETAPPVELDDESADGIARTLQRALAQSSAPVSGSSHAALLHLLA